MSIIGFMKPIKFYSEVYLMAPFRSENENFLVADYSIWVILRIISLFGFSTAFPILDFMYFREKHSNRGLTMDSIFIFYSCLKIPVFLVSFLQAHLRRHVVIDFLNNSQQFENHLNKLLHVASHRGMSNKLNYGMVFSGFSLSVLYVCLLMIDTGKQVWNITKTGNLLLHIIFQQVTMVVILQWITYHLILQRQVKLLNMYLSSISRSSWRKDNLGVTGTAYKLFNQIIRQADNLNEAYSWQVLTIVPYVFSMLLYNMYYLYKIGIENFKNSLHIIFEVAVGFTVLFSLVLPCSMTTREAENFRWILMNIDLHLQEDPMTQEMINLLLMQALHHPIQFSALQVFFLDMSLITSVWKTLATYLVILVQNY